MQEKRKVLLMMETSRKYGRSILRGIAKYSRTHGPWIFYRRAPFYWGTGVKEATLEQLLKLGIDGVILREQREQEQTDRILAEGLPVIVSPYRELFEGFPNIVTDDAAIGSMAAEYLLHRGFKQFAYCGFGDMYYWSRERGKSFAESVERTGFQTHHYEYEQPKSRSPHPWEAELVILVDWLKRLPKPVALMACNDDRSQDVLEACKIANLNVPEQVAILGLGDDDLVCDLASPPLSSIALSAERSGYEAASILDKLMSGQEISDRKIVVPPSYVVTRQSTDILTIDDPYVADALRFIYRRARKEAIQVNDVLRAIPISRRSLYERFAGILGRSVHEEIKRVRVEHLARLLVSTKLSISQIASSLGCSDMKNLARYFKQVKEMSPLEYRKHHSIK
jgi:LacI family transcriptional regulator